MKTMAAKRAKSSAEKIVSGYKKFENVLAREISSLESQMKDRKKILQKLKQERDLLIKELGKLRVRIDQVSTESEKKVEVLKAQLTQAQKGIANLISSQDDKFSRIIKEMKGTVSSLEDKIIVVINDFKLSSGEKLDALEKFTSGLERELAVTDDRLVGLAKELADYRERAEKIIAEKIMKIKEDQLSSVDKLSRKIDAMGVEVNADVRDLDENVVKLTETIEGEIKRIGERINGLETLHRSQFQELSGEVGRLDEESRTNSQRDEKLRETIKRDVQELDESLIKLTEMVEGEVKGIKERISGVKALHDSSVGELKGKVRELNEDLASQIQENAQTLNIIQKDLTSNLKDINGRLSALKEGKADVSTLNDEIVSINSLISEQIGSLESSREEMLTNVKNLNERLTNTVVNLTEKMEESIENVNRVLNATVDNVSDKLNTSLIGFEKRMNEFEKDISTRVNDVENRSIKLDDAMREFRDRHGKFGIKFDNWIKNFNDFKESVSTNFAGFSSHLQNYGEKMSSAEDRLSSLENSKTEIMNSVQNYVDSKFGEFVKNALDKDESIKSLISEIRDGVDKRISSLRRDSDEAMASISQNINEKIDTLSDNLNRIEGALASSFSEIKGLDEKLKRSDGSSAKKGEVSRVMKVIEEQSKRLGGLASEASKLREKLDGLENNIVNFDSKVSNIEETKMRTINKKLNEIMGLKDLMLKMMNETKGKVKELEDGMPSKFRNQRKVMEELREEVESLRRKVPSTRALGRRIKDLEKRLEEKEKFYKSLTRKVKAKGKEQKEILKSVLKELKS